jgi:hypothetical protein
MSNFICSPKKENVPFKLTDKQLMIQKMVRNFSREMLAKTAEKRDKTKDFLLRTLRKLEA